MKKYCEMSREELLDLKKELDREFDEIKAEGLAAVTMVSSTESRKPRDFSVRCQR